MSAEQNVGRQDGGKIANEVRAVPRHCWWSICSILYFGAGASGVYFASGVRVRTNTIPYVY